jgi:hypothetical protein
MCSLVNSKPTLLDAEPLPAELADADPSSGAAIDPAVPASDRATLWRAVNELQAMTLEAARRARATGNLSGLLIAIRAARANYELLARLTRRVDPVAEVDLLTHPDWHRFRSVLLEALDPFPEARLAVAERLDQIDEEQDQPVPEKGS